MAKGTLLDFVKQSRLDLVKNYLEEGENANDSDSSDRTSLHHAVLESHEKMAELLLEHGADVNASDVFCKTPLHYAVLETDVGIVELLLNYSANVNALCYRNETPLHLAAIDPDADIFKLLLMHGADVNALDILSRTPLHCAVREPHADVVKLLLEHGANVNSVRTYKLTPLHIAVLSCHVDIVNLLLEHGANVNALTFTNCTPLHSAADSPHKGIVKLLLEHGANVNFSNIFNETPLHDFVYKYCVDIVRLLLDHGANINNENNLGQTPLHHFLSVEKCDEKQLLREKQRIRQKFLSLKKPNISLLQMLLQYGANVNAVDQSGIHVLSLAVHNLTTPYETVKLLLENGAIPDFCIEKNILIDISQPKCDNLAELLIQYIILRLSLSHEMFEVLDQFKSVLLVHNAKESDSYKHFLRIASSCIDEIMYMKNDYICKQTLYQFVSDNYLRTSTHQQSVVLSDIDELLLLLSSSKYVVCKELICATIKRSDVIERLYELEIFYQTVDSVNITLNYECLYNLTDYISKDDVVNLSIVFCHDVIMQHYQDV